jgi:hypothetical protein
LVQKATSPIFTPNHGSWLFNKYRSILEILAQQGWRSSYCVFLRPLTSGLSGGKSGHNRERAIAPRALATTAGTRTPMWPNSRCKCRRQGPFCCCRDIEEAAPKRRPGCRVRRRWAPPLRERCWRRNKDQRNNRNGCTGHHLVTEISGRMVVVFLLPGYLFCVFALLQLLGFVVIHGMESEFV